VVFTVPVSCHCQVIPGCGCHAVSGRGTARAGFGMYAHSAISRITVKANASGNHLVVGKGFLCLPSTATKRMRCTKVLDFGNLATS
jgi:hypothetical protein